MYIKQVSKHYILIGGKGIRKSEGSRNVMFVSQFENMSLNSQGFKLEGFYFATWGLPLITYAPKGRG